MSEITKAIQSICAEKNLSYESVLETIETALAAAYRKDFGNKQQNIKAKFDPEKGDIKVWDVKTVVDDVSEENLLAAQEELTARREKAREENRELTEEETADLPRFNIKTEIMFAAAKEIDKKVKIGDVLEIPLEIPGDFGRMAAQTAKQVVIQKLREAERNMVFGDYKSQEGKIVTGIVQQIEGNRARIDLGKISGIIPPEEQIMKERLRPGSRVKVLILFVDMTPRGPEIILSRSNEGLVREIFKQEIPEVGEDKIEIKGVARDAGWRSKVAVASKDESIDPIGSCIGQRGGRINTIIEELGGEKIDIIQYNEDTKQYISNALSPAKVLKVELNEKTRNADVFVAPDQFSLAIGHSGQNVRLAAQLTGWNIKVKEDGTNNEVSSIDSEENTDEIVESENKEAAPVKNEELKKSDKEKTIKKKKVKKAKETKEK
ncbi:MAG: transcription termination factor NusA [Patescibacteria group bacterium]|nr:transcription termination factor NusA [Patescibacteria group bacterium]